MKKIISILIFILSIAIAHAAQSAVTTLPSSLTMSEGLPATRSVTFTISDPDCASTATSTSGEFTSGSTVLGTENRTLSTTLTSGVRAGVYSGSVTETLTIPKQVIKKATEAGLNVFEYRRTFSVGTGPDCSITSQTGTVTMHVTSKAEADLRITRLQLYFENKKAETTIKKNQPAHKAFADIKFVGSGFLRGYWEVDGRILSNVYKHLIYGKSITLETPDIPSLPTFETGTHRVRFVITSPVPEIVLPEAIYFVTADEFKTVLPIKLISPEHRAEKPYAPFTFTWEQKGNNVIYLIEFLEEGGNLPIFSAYTKTPDYKLPQLLFQSIFDPGKTYHWRVKGFDDESKMAAESSMNTFTFAGP